MRTAARLALYAGLVAAEVSVLVAYLGRGTGWHWLLHTGIGVGLGLAAAGVASGLGGRVRRPLPWAVGGQLVSITPDLIFRFGLLPHRPWMNVFVGHITVHTAPAPLLVATALVLLGGASWHAAASGRRWPAALLAAAAAGLLLGALAVARPLPTRLSDYARDSRGHPAAGVVPSPYTREEVVQTLSTNWTREVAVR